jgi:hypothetical protein
MIQAAAADFTRELHLQIEVNPKKSYPFEQPPILPEADSEHHGRGYLWPML